MCGRFTLQTSYDELFLRFDLEKLNFPYSERYNIAPTQQILAVRNQSGQNTPVEMRWGLIPSWAKDSKIGNRMINARQETLSERVSFKNLIQRKRCLILADGFYEWQKTDSGKKPQYIRVNNGTPFAMAGLWDSWVDSSGNNINSCTIITTIANKKITPIHHRMPVILRPQHEQLWISGDHLTREQLDEICTPYEDDKITYYQVSTLVNSPKNDNPECILHHSD